MALTTEATPVWEPTEMSRPPQMMTTVWTMASRPVMVAASARIHRLVS
ncbi:hypothetical protein OG393_01825 [Streptomyces sp. NBC_01216]|nr:hypothetical protein OG393_01825 [Streptomyces sp. NBC_01216]